MILLSLQALKQRCILFTADLAASPQHFCLQKEMFCMSVLLHIICTFQVGNLRIVPIATMPQFAVKLSFAWTRKLLGGSSPSWFFPAALSYIKKSMSRIQRCCFKLNKTHVEFMRPWRLLVSILQLVLGYMGKGIWCLEFIQIVAVGWTSWLKAKRNRFKYRRTGNRSEEEKCVLTAYSKMCVYGQDNSGEL